MQAFITFLREISIGQLEKNLLHSSIMINAQVSRSVSDSFRPKRLLSLAN